MPDRTRARHPWLLVAVVLSGLSTSRALVTVVLQPQDGQKFAEAVATYGSSGEDTVLLLPRGQVFSLANVTIRDANVRTYSACTAARLDARAPGRLASGLGIARQAAGIAQPARRQLL